MFIFILIFVIINALHIQYILHKPKHIHIVVISRVYQNDSER